MFACICRVYCFCCEKCILHITVSVVRWGNVEKFMHICIKEKSHTLVLYYNLITLTLQLEKTILL